MSEELFTTTMKKATRKAHAVSDALVNAKLLFALNDDRVWAEGLLVFYEIFKFLEIEMKERRDENIGKLYVEEMKRTPAFEEDLAFYLGPNWQKTYSVRESVRNYLKHLEHVSSTNSDLLMAYVYHLYLGLMSGGQILKKKRELQKKVMSTNEGDPGNAVTTFKNIEISHLKNQLKDKMNAIASTLDDEKKMLLVEESVKVFELNNTIIRSVQGVDSVAFKNVFSVLSLTFAVLGIIYYLYRYTQKSA